MNNLWKCYNIIICFNKTKGTIKYNTLILKNKVKLKKYYYSIEKKAFSIYNTKVRKTNFRK
jgi:hypothetical protein